MTKTRTALVTLTTMLALGGLAACGDNDQVEGSDRDKAEKAALAETGSGEVVDVEKSDDDEQEDHAYEVQVNLDNGDEVDVELDEDFNVVRTDVDTNDANAAPTEDPSESSSPTDAATDDDAPLTGKTLDQASKAALAAAGGGTVTDTSVSDDADHAYEVEVTLDNGDQVDVDLDEAFKVVRQDLDRADR